MQSKLAHESSAARERELQSEVTLLRDRLSSKALEGTSNRDEEEAGSVWEIKRLRRDLDHSTRALSEIEDQVVELTSTLARVEREKKSLKVSRLTPLITSQHQ